MESVPDPLSLAPLCTMYDPEQDQVHGSSSRPPTDPYLSLSAQASISKALPAYTNILGPCKGKLNQEFIPFQRIWCTFKRESAHPLSHIDCNFRALPKLNQEFKNHNFQPIWKDMVHIQEEKCPPILPYWFIIQNPWPFEITLYIQHLWFNP